MPVPFILGDTLNYIGGKARYIKPEQHLDLASYNPYKLLEIDNKAYVTVQSKILSSKTFHIHWSWFQKKNSLSEEARLIMYQFLAIKKNE